jgi:amino acid adenylation domain-containing protein
MQQQQNIDAAVLEQAAAHPERPAVVAGDSVVTFGELADHSRALAARLRAAGVRRETVVVSCLPRGAAMVTSVLGTWLAGGAYLPIDPAAPESRAAHMLRDSDARVVVAQQGSTVPGLADIATVPTIIPVDCVGAVCGAAEPAEFEPTAPGDLAYVIYTSGSTGRPKGVLVEHGSLADMAATHEAVLHPAGAPTTEQVALNAVATADTFFSDFVNLAAGRTLVVVDEATRRDPERLARLLTQKRIDVFDGTPTQLRTLFLAGRGAALAGLRTLIIGNEPADSELWHRLRDLAASGVRVHNFYGPTECTIDVTSAAVADHPEPVIGTPLPGVEIWLVDQALRPVPDGEPGEICVAGPCLARGYLNAAPDDEARFAWLTPATGREPVRVYRTGDRARRGAARQLEFLGRIDDQANIAGYRVEPLEVESAVRSCPGMLDAAVAVTDRAGSAVLTAWVVLAPGTGAADIAARLGSMLPPYMVPTLVSVAGIPMGASGKADVAALKALQANSEAGTAADQDPDAGALAAIWRDVLGLDAVGAQDDFFALGGDSLKATRLIMAVRAAISPDLPIRVIFDNPGFAAFAGAVAQRGER